MRGKRAKQIRKLCNQMNPHILLAIKNKYNKAPEDFKELNIYKYAKRIWKEDKPQKWFA